MDGCDTVQFNVWSYLHKCPDTEINVGRNVVTSWLVVTFLLRSTRPCHDPFEKCNQPPNSMVSELKRTSKTFGTGGLYTPYGCTGSIWWVFVLSDVVFCQPVMTLRHCINSRLCCYQELATSKTLTLRSCAFKQVYVQKSKESRRSFLEGIKFGGNVMASISHFPTPPSWPHFPIFPPLVGYFNST